ncbi:hypothetical protein D9758_009881 [Tetrapyrgos nigripes]|uniref:NADAR domain-containing protein n=1 Tax=Tetrapyrgos nigripes TaxID=182062 RepID=A0A8H5GMH1_9AGAR|nr:hypothetical protein D9758_009881 [Tetrapyrgos nigripes]
MPLMPSPASPLPPGNPIPAAEYRVELEERRKHTIYVTSDIHPSQWGSQNFDRLLRLVDNQNDNRNGTGSLPGNHISPSGVPRSKSAQEIHTSPIRPLSSRYQANRHTMKPSDTLKVTQFYTAPNSPASNSHQGSPIRPKVYFYHKQDPHYGFTNFSSHSVMYKGKRYPTSEHLFQSFKANHRPGLAEHIRTCSERPSVAFSEARRFQPEVRPDWKSVNIEKMDVTLRHKFNQHSDLKQELLDTGDAELIEILNLVKDSDKDAFWGVGADRQGRNELGKALERLRAELRATQTV